MPQIFDNIEKKLAEALGQTLSYSDRADFCVGYFNLRGWKTIDQRINDWAGDEAHRCRLLVGMRQQPGDELRQLLTQHAADKPMDNQTAIRLRRQLAEDFRAQLAIGTPSNEDEQGLRRLAAQIKAKKVVVKLFLRHPLHAKLYLLFRPDPVNPIVGYVGSSNLTLAGLANQGELNVDVMDHDAGLKLAAWFNARWDDKFCVDISDDLVKIIEESWAGERLIPPHHIYVKMAYHLSQDARAGLTEFYIPADFQNVLLDFQKAAVKIAAHHLNKRGGVLLGDVVGLGKTMMATALARVVQETQGISTLIICPPKLIPMWQRYIDTYGLTARVVSLGSVAKDLSDVPARFRLVLIDESHNLRNREGSRHAQIQEYIRQSGSRVILLSATPYNKTYLDLSSQLRLFVDADTDLGVRPEKLIKELGEDEFIRRHQCSLRSLAAFEKSSHADDWRDLMRLYLVRRTRGFIKENYGKIDPSTGQSYLSFADGRKSYFPDRVPKNVSYSLDDKDPDDQYAKLYSQPVVDTINDLRLPRYGLGNYVATPPRTPPTTQEAQVIDDLSRAGPRLKGFCRTNLFKRLESSGHAFIQSIDRHILRNFIVLHAIEEGLPIPIGTQDMGLLDLPDETQADDGMDLFSDGDEPGRGRARSAAAQAAADYRERAADIYEQYADEHKRRFKWLPSSMFSKDLARDLLTDCKALIGLLNKAGTWNATNDAKLNALYKLLTRTHPNEKVLIFSQFADTVDYLERELVARGIDDLAGVTGDTNNPTEAAWRFSPVSNSMAQTYSAGDEYRVLIATDVLSEGQNLQDCSVIVNFDLPWAIIRLIQRAGRVDRIGQQAAKILCYSFLPADGVERIIRLRSRVRARLQQNAEVVGTDESFFEDDPGDAAVRNLFTETAGLLDGDGAEEVDLGSYAYQIWKNAIEREPKLEQSIPLLPPVCHASQILPATTTRTPGALVYLRTAQRNDALAWIGRDGSTVTESQFEILRAAECLPGTPAVPRHGTHYELVAKAVELVDHDEQAVGGQLGRPSGARFKVWSRMKNFAESLRGTLYESPLLEKAVDDIYRFPLTTHATDTLNRLLKGGAPDARLRDIVMALREEGRLCHIDDDATPNTRPEIICSMGLIGPNEGLTHAP
jgi:superfamily II DNA or RNA helicase